MFEQLRGGVPQVWADVLPGGAKAWGLRSSLGGRGRASGNGRCGEPGEVSRDFLASAKPPDAFRRPFRRARGLQLDRDSRMGWPRLTLLFQPILPAPAKTCVGGRLLEAIIARHRLRAGRVAPAIRESTCGALGGTRPRAWMTMTG